MARANGELHAYKPDLGVRPSKAV